MTSFCSSPLGRSVSAAIAMLILAAASRFGWVDRTSAATILVIIPILTAMNLLEYRRGHRDGCAIRSGNA